jgi:hypothetical protein
MVTYICGVELLAYIFSIIADKNEITSASVLGTSIYYAPVFDFFFPAYAYACASLYY